MIKLKTNESYKFGQINCLPIIGEISISSEGIIEVESEEIALQIEELNIGFAIVELEEEVATTTTTAEPTTTTTTTEAVETTTMTTVEEKVEDLEKEQLIASLETMTLAQLKEAAKPFPFTEWGTLNKQPLLEYLKSKI